MGFDHLGIWIETRSIGDWKEVHVNASGFETAYCLCVVISISKFLGERNRLMTFQFVLLAHSYQSNYGWLGCWSNGGPWSGWHRLVDEAGAYTRTQTRAGGGKKVTIFHLVHVSDMQMLFSEWIQLYAIHLPG